MQQIFKGKKLTTNKVVKNLMTYYESANSAQISSGLIWYKAANKFCKDIAKKSGLDLFRVCGIVSALSPQTSWDLNKELAYKFIILGKRSKLHNGAQINKAERCLTAENETEIFDFLSIGGIKTSQFFRNIYFYDRDLSVTIDRHALASCIQKTNKVKSLNNVESKMTTKQYHFFANCFKSAAAKLEILPHDLQAIIWLVYREFRGLPLEYKINNSIQEVAPF